MSLNEFIRQYFIAPVLVEQGYNVYNTIAYALIAFGLLYLLHKVFERIKLKIDFKFLLALLPFIFFGSFTRVLVDHRIIERSFWTVSPGIYLLTTFVFLSALLLALIHQNYTKHTYWKLALILGLLADITMLTQGKSLLPTNIRWSLISITLVAIGSYAILLASRKLKWVWFTTKLGFAAIVAHTFDAVNTFILSDYFGGFEKHPLPRLLIEKAGSGAAFIPVKLAVILPTVYLITTGVENKNWRNLLLVTIATLGFAEGLRNFINLILI